MDREKMTLDPYQERHRSALQEAAKDPKRAPILERIERDFTYHRPTGDQVGRYEALRGAGMALAEFITVYTPVSREQSLALTHVEEAVMWANAAIARNEGGS